MGRSRIVRIKDKIIITNYKCMFSSLNILNTCELNPKDNPKYEKIMLYRDPKIRTISCFLNWMMGGPNRDRENLMRANKKRIIDDGEFGWLLTILCKQKEFNLTHYKTLLKDQNVIELFKQYLELLPKIYLMQNHMHPQCKIVKNNKFNIDIFINIDNREEILLFENKIKQKTVKNNCSEDEDKDLLIKFLDLNTQYMDIIKKVYEEDIEFLPDLL